MTETGQCQLCQQIGELLPGAYLARLIQRGLSAQATRIITCHEFGYIPGPASHGAKTRFDQGDRPGSEDTVHPQPVSIHPGDRRARLAECSTEPVLQALDIITLYHQLPTIHPGHPEGTGITLLQVLHVCVLQTGIRIS